MNGYRHVPQTDHSVENLHDDIVRLRAQGLTVPRIMGKLNISESRVRQHLTIAGLVRFGQRGPHAETYEHEGRRYTVKQLAKIAGVSWVTMWRRLKRWEDVGCAIEGSPPEKNEQAEEQEGGEENHE